MIEKNESKTGDQEELLCCNCQCGVPELHEKVLQTVYGAGLRLVKLKKTFSTDSQLINQLDILIQEMDQAIKDLRRYANLLPHGK